MLNLQSRWNQINNKMIFIISLLGFLFPLISLLTDPEYIYLVKEGVKNIHFFYIFRILSSIGCGLIVLKSYFNKVNIKYDVPILYFLYCFYAVSGQLFLPFYYVILIESIIIFAFFLKIQKRIYYAISTFFSITSVYIVYTNNISYSPNNVPLLDMYRFDVFNGVLFALITGYFGYNFVVKTVLKKEIATQKFYEVGKHTASIIHDLKGAVMPPNTYINRMKKELEKDNPDIEQLKIMNSYLQEDFETLKEMINNINELSKNDEKFEQFSIQQLSSSIIKSFFKNEIYNIKIEFSGDDIIFYNKFSMYSILVNAFSNSIHNFNQIKTDSKIIKIIKNNNKIMIMDNGGGFPSKILKNLDNNEFYTTKENGSGLGLFLMQDYAIKNNSSMKFYNKNEWAVIEITI